MNEEIQQVTEAAKSPVSYSVLTYCWVLALSAWGGAVRFIRKVKAGDMSFKQAALTLTGEIITSAFAGVVTFYACEAYDVNQLMTAVLVSIAGHMGGRAIEPLESIYKHWSSGGKP